MEEEDIRCIRKSKVSLQNAQINYLHLSPCEEKKKSCFVFLWLALVLRVHSNYNLLKASNIFSRKHSIKKKKQKQNTVVVLTLEGSSTPLRFHKRGN